MQRENGSVVCSSSGPELPRTLFLELVDFGAVTQIGEGNRCASKPHSSNLKKCTNE